MRKLQELATCEYERFHALITWAESLGCCYICSVMCACATVQREARNLDWGKPPTVCCTNPQYMINENHCPDLYVANWKDAPKK